MTGPENPLLYHIRFGLPWINSKYNLWIIYRQLLDLFLSIHFASWFFLPSLPLCISRRGWVDSKRIKLRWKLFFQLCCTCSSDGHDEMWIIAWYVGSSIESYVYTKIKANYDGFQRWTLHNINGNLSISLMYCDIGKHQSVGATDAFSSLAMSFILQKHLSHNVHIKLGYNDSRQIWTGYAVNNMYHQ